MKQNKFKKTAQILLIIFALLPIFVSCDNEEQNQISEMDFTGTKWKLESFMNTKTGESIKPEPQICDNCYTISFYENGRGTAMSFANEIMVNLYDEPIFGAMTKFDDNDNGNVKLFYEAIKAVDSYSFENGELKLYFGNNEKIPFRGFLLYKQVEIKEDTRKVYSTKEGRIDINENEYTIMRMLPETGLLDSSKKLIIENHSKRELVYGQAFSLEYFDGKNWTKIQLDLNFEMIGYILKEGETAEEKFCLSEEYFKTSGKYRIIKSFTSFANFPFDIIDDVFRNFNLCVEIEIK